MARGLPFLRVTLDTTSPILTIYLPNNTTNESLEDITITSNEILSNRQEIYIIDSLGKRHDYTFSQIDDYTFYGRISFQAFPIGMTTLYARLYDEVWNASDLYTKHFNILDPQNIKMFLSEYKRKLELEIIPRTTVVDIQERKFILSEKIMKTVSTNEKWEGEGEN